MTGQLPTDPADAESISAGPVNGFEVLAKLTGLPVSTWRYRRGRRGWRHLGPMAQDWRGAFELGQGDTTIPVVDAHGVLDSRKPGPAPPTTPLTARCRPRCSPAGPGVGGG